ncbi:MAG: zf-HC2 domain-containing protein [Clostridia bacterium]|nr:zf-HC2 domain-containing protein [Clostridia bacterium]
MNCEIIKDIMPLVIDDCCSEESKKLVREHIAGCEECRKIYEEMASAVPELTEPAPKKRKLEKLNAFRASVMQSLALFLSFAVITVGVGLEAASPEGARNGFWLFALIIPATAFLLSLANLYFIRAYPSRRRFRAASLLLTVFFAAAAFVWGVIHYGVIGSLKAGSLSPHIAWGMGIGLALVLLACAASFLLADHYARSLGKE